MKKELSALAATFVALLALLSCGSGNSPKGVTEQFVKAIQKQDGEKMADLVYYEEGKGPTTAGEKEQVAAMMSGKISTTYANNGKLKSYEILSEELSDDGSEAIVKVKMEFERKTSEDNIKLKKDGDGNWKIDMSK